VHKRDGARRELGLLLALTADQANDEDLENEHVTVLQCKKSSATSVKHEGAISQLPSVDLEGTTNPYRSLGQYHTLTWIKGSFAHTNLPNFSYSRIGSANP